MRNAAPDYESSPLRVFLEADEETQKELALEAFREGNNLLRDFVDWRVYLTGDDPWSETLEDMDWLLEMAAASSDLRALVKTYHVTAEDNYYTPANLALLLIQEALDRVPIDPDGTLASTFQELDYGVQIACFISAEAVPHPSSHEPLTTLHRLNPATLLNVLDFMVEELEWMSEEGARLLVTTTWDEEQFVLVYGLYEQLRDTTEDPAVLQWLELFARKHDWSEYNELRFEADYARSFSVSPLLTVPGESVEKANMWRDEEVRVIVPSTPSALLLKVWWQTIQKNEPHRLTKDLLTAFVGNENTPEAIRDEAQIELDFHYAD